MGGRPAIPSRTDVAILKQALSYDRSKRTMPTSMGARARARPRSDNLEILRASAKGLIDNSKAVGRHQ